MKEENGIDKVFKEGLGEYNITPPTYVWDNISDKMAGYRRKRYLLLIRSAAAAILLLIAFSTGYFINQSNQKNSSTLIGYDILDLKTLDDSSDKIGANRDKDAVNQKNQSQSENSGINQNSFESLRNIQADNSRMRVKTVQVKSRKSYHMDRVEKNDINPSFVDNFKVDIDNSTLMMNERDKDNRKRFLARYNDIPEKNFYSSLDEADNGHLIAKKSQNRWSVSGKISPTYNYRDLKNNSTSSVNATTKDFNQTENALIAYSGGFAVNYKASEKIIIESGVYFSKSGQKIDDLSVQVFRSPENNNFLDLSSIPSNANYSGAYAVFNSAGSIEITGARHTLIDSNIKTDRVNGVLFDATESISSSLADAEIQQNFEFVEVPVKLKYNILDSKLDLNLIGGLSANFLISNYSHIEYLSQSESLGPTSGIKEISYSSIFGLGLNYPLGNKINLLLEPHFKYHLTPLNQNNTIEFIPFTYGIYTGINFEL